MAITPSRLGQALLKSTPTLVLAVTTGLSVTIRSITAPNNTTGTRRLSVWLVPSGGSPDDSNILANELEVPGRGLAQDDAVHVLMIGGKVYGMSDIDDAFTLTVDGAANS